MAVLAERHDLAHAVESDGAWNESLYFNTYDDATDVGFFTRIGIRPNEGRVEGACFVWLPGGGTASVSEVGARHEVSDTGFEIGGMRYDRMSPMPGLMKTRPGWATRFRSRGTSTSTSR